MRFPHKAYAEMVAAEESSLNTRQVAKDSAVEKKEVSDSAIEGNEEFDSGEPDLDEEEI